MNETEQSIKTRIDMKHGFMKSIIKNQVDRDNYDKEVKAIKAHEKLPRQENKPRKPDAAVYVPPNRSVPIDKTGPEIVENAEEEDEGPVKLFTFEFQDKDKKVYKQYVMKGVSAELLARRMGMDRKLPPNMIKALQQRLQEEIDKRTKP